MVGCGNPAAEKMSTGEEANEWDGLANFESGPMLSIGYPAEMGDWASVKKAVAADDFAAAVSALEGSNPPDSVKDALTTAVSDLRALIEAGKSGSTEDLKAKHAAAMKSIAALRG